MKIYELQNRKPVLEVLLNIWETSVRATHHFLSDAEKALGNSLFNMESRTTASKK